MLAVPADLLARPFQGSAAIAAGRVTRAQLRGTSWLRLFPDVYVHRGVPVTHGLRARAAAEFVVPDAVITGVSAAVLWGVALAGPTDEVELSRWPGGHPVRVHGLRVRRFDIEDRYVVRHEGAWVTTPEATAVSLAGQLTGDDAVISVDRMVHEANADLAEIRWLAGIGLGPGSRRARATCDAADGLAASPQETRTRLAIHRGGLPRPTAQYRVVHRGCFVARVDFAWPELRVAVEYDGLWHAEPRQFARDRERLNRLREAGWTVVFVTAADLRDPPRLVSRIRAALAAATR